MKTYPIIYLFLMLLGGAWFVTAVVSFGSLGPEPADPNHVAGIFGGLWLVTAGMTVVSVVFWIFGLIHALINKALQGNDRIIWVVVVVFLNALGALVYFFVAPDPKRSSLQVETRREAV